LVTAQNAFGLTLVQKSAVASSPNNVFLSPLSVFAALAMAMGGAAGATRAAFAETLFGEALASAEIEQALATQLRQLSESKDGQAALRIVSSLWADQRFTLAPEFVEWAHALYQAEAATLDFTAPGAAATINAWAQRQTEGRIQEIVSDRMLAGPPPASVVLLNAVYFQARWRWEFNPANTKPGVFTQADGTTQQALFMRQASSYLGYLADDGWQAVALPYEGYPRRTSMLVFLPNEPQGLPAFLATLDATRWAAWHRALSTRTEPVEVVLALPRFQLEWSSNLASTLSNMGLAAALGAEADFSPLGFRAEDGGFIGAVLHKTFLAVDEQGTEAAAVTALVMIGGGGRPLGQPRRVAVRVNSPFFCAIVDDETGALLFAGTVNKLT
jgi:serpin B